MNEMKYAVSSTTWQPSVPKYWQWVGFTNQNKDGHSGREPLYAYIITIHNYMSCKRNVIENASNEVTVKKETKVRSDYRLSWWSWGWRRELLASSDAMEETLKNGNLNRPHVIVVNTGLVHVRNS